MNDTPAPTAAKPELAQPPKAPANPAASKAASAPAIKASPINSACANQVTKADKPASSLAEHLATAPAEHLESVTRPHKIKQFVKAAVVERIGKVGKSAHTIPAGGPTPPADSQSHIMKKITAEEFALYVKANPAWAAALTEPLEVTGYCDMAGSEITHLSPWLHFSGDNETGDAASFESCKSLKSAEGIFHGFVTFFDAGISNIGDLVVTRPNHLGEAADFIYCEYLVPPPTERPN